VPLVFLDGHPSYAINEWISYLLDEQITNSRLEQFTRSICQLYDFSRARFGLSVSDKEIQLLIPQFIDAKVYGTDGLCSNNSKDYLKNLGLNWKPVKRKTVQNHYLGAINDFDKWQSTYHHSDRLNPSEKRLMTHFEQYNDFKNRKNWDMLVHLYPSKVNERESFKHSAYGKFEHSRKKNRKSNKLKKSFPIDRFIELIDSAPNPRDKLLWLLMGGASLRRSEPLHLFFTDIEGMNNYGELKVLLDDPEDGMIEWSDLSGNNHVTTREKYVESNFKNMDLPDGHKLRDLQVRTKYGRRNVGLNAGFKNMTFSDSDASTAILGTVDSRIVDRNHAFWIDPRLGKKAKDVYDEYVNEYVYVNPHTGKTNPSGFPYHPWLFININKNDYGTPMSISGVKRAWGRAIERLNLQGCGLGLHSLRHFYGYYGANVLKIPDTMMMAMFHHSSIESTKTYYVLDKAVIRNEITMASLASAGLEGDLKYIIPPNTQKLDFPSDWSGRSVIGMSRGDE